MKNTEIKAHIQLMKIKLKRGELMKCSMIEFDHEFIMKICIPYSIGQMSRLKVTFEVSGWYTNFLCNELMSCLIHGIIC
jgi:hypothetical protein